MDKTLVGVDHLLEVDRLVDVMGEGSVAVEILIGSHDILNGERGLHNLSGEDAAGKVATVRDEVDGCRKLALACLYLHLTQALAYLRHMLMLEWLVYAHVVVAPREVGCGTRLLSGTSRTRYGVHRNIVVDDAELCGRQQSELNAGGKATWVSNVLRLGNGVTVNLRQTIHIVITLALQAEVLCQVDYLNVLWNLMFIQERLALAMTETEEHNVHIIERHLRRKAQVGVAIQSLVHIGDEVAGIALAVNKRYFGFGVIDKYADKLTGCVAGSAEDSYFHNFISAHRDEYHSIHAAE